ncbi:MAG: deoxyribodipyrimidine photo-lyase [Burkholderiaceae bacterium]
MTSTKPPPVETALVWLRRDLRLEDNAALAAAIATGKPVCVAFVFDQDILRPLPAHDRRVAFIHHAVHDLDERLRKWGAGVYVRHGNAANEIVKLARELNAGTVFAASDYEPAAKQRDEDVSQTLATQDRSLELVTDQTLHTPGSILTGAGKPYTVFTPFKKNFLSQTTEQTFAAAPASSSAVRKALLTGQKVPAVPSLKKIGFESVDLAALSLEPTEAGAQRALQDFADRVGRYDEQRDYPGVRGPSYLSIHLRFGTVSVRECARLAQRTMMAEPAAAKGAQVWLSELIWRDFYFQILHHFPHVVERSFRPEYDKIQWVQDEELFQAWCEGQTGYPLVDAAMAQINQTGYMHNRLRMIVASFLTKDLGIHWQKGEAYFAEKLNDFDLSANNGGWQWAASSGCDAQPYFRIFNPVTQSQRFDPRGRFIRRYLPELDDLSDKQIHAPWLTSETELASKGIELGKTYPLPAVDHAAARKETLERYAVVKAQK